MNKLLILCLCFTVLYANERTLVKRGEKWEFVDGMVADGRAWVKYQNTVNQTGWGVLDIKVNGSYPADQQAYAAGYDTNFQYSHKV
jgi:hypothetical protein